MRSSKFTAWALSALLMASGGARAQEKAPEAPPPGPNVRITLALGQTDSDAAVRTFEMLARDGTVPGEMLIGWRVPIPTARTGDEEEEGGVTSYVYQNVGVTARLQAIVLPDARILVRGEIEASGTNEGPAALAGQEKLPIVATFQQSIDVILTDGRPMRVAEVPDPEGGRRYLDVTARVQR